MTARGDFSLIELLCGVRQSFLAAGAENALEREAERPLLQGSPSHLSELTWVCKTPVQNPAFGLYPIHRHGHCIRIWQVGYVFGPNVSIGFGKLLR
jgi:hypothetical protein